MTRTTRFLAVAAALAIVAAIPAAAQAKVINYKGKTSGGHQITFKREGKRVWYISTLIPTVCLPTNRVGERSITGAEYFTPPGYEIVGRKVTFKDLQPAALYYNDVTKHYEITLKKGKKGKLRGKLHLSQSFIIPTFPMPTMIYYSCVGKATFTAKPVKKRR
jgi:hypothetical protein